MTHSEFTHRLHRMATEWELWPNDDDALPEKFLNRLALWVEYTAGIIDSPTRDKP